MRRQVVVILAARACALQPPPLADFKDVWGRYDAFLLDQFGVVHDGKRCYVGSAECVRFLQAAGKRVVVLSNSSKRRRETIERLQGLACGMCTYLDAADVVEGVPAISVFTSGDLVHVALASLQRDEADSVLEGALGPGQNRVFVFGNGDDDDTYLRTAGLESSDVSDADFLLARGLFCTVGAERRDLQWTEEACDDILEAAAARALPMIVANPDLVRPDGASSPMPGVLARRYADFFRGRCVLVGKPHEAIYDAALASLASMGITDKTRIAAVGDSMHHDVLGANAAGLDSIFVAGGVHAAQLGVLQGAHRNPDSLALDAFFATFAASDLPTITIPGFTMAPSLDPPQER
ncbi:hypothetical protein CTAYLR_000800 [Chrysophaeum taylorii]|uniref:Uncharacterized protein n=1 Tax=Chrysophaeum taylorii TaxID=2483200 RepID=A0AAD7UQ55_9STRA|nr:hypothetical protein CTAYLR_000800 [Chrysophaeum taylorii]